VGNKAVPLAMAVVLIAAGAVFYFSRSHPPANNTPALTAEAKAYVQNLRLSGVSIKATESFAKQTITEIEGTIANAGDRAVRSVEIVCVFYDPYGQVILRERVPIVKAALKPGESRPFRLAFDDIPASWNNQAPQLVIAGILFS
jgi:hypothetical protein